MHRAGDCCSSAGIAEEAASRPPTRPTSAVATRPTEPENVAALLAARPARARDRLRPDPARRRRRGRRPARARHDGAPPDGHRARPRRSPPIRIRDNVQLGSHEYAVKIRGVEVARWALHAGPAARHEPGRRRPAARRASRPSSRPSACPPSGSATAQREHAEISGYTVVDPTSVVITHLTEVIRRNAAELLGRQDVRALLDAPQGALPGAGRRARARPADRRRGAARAAEPARARRVSIRDLVHDPRDARRQGASCTKDVPILTEYCRQALSRAICGRFVDETGTLRAITLDPEIDREIAESVAPHRGRDRRDDGPRARLGPDREPRGAGRRTRRPSARRRSSSARARRGATSRPSSPTRSRA